MQPWSLESFTLVHDSHPGPSYQMREFGKLKRGNAALEMRDEEGDRVVVGRSGVGIDVQRKVTIAPQETTTSPMTTTTTTAAAATTTAAAAPPSHVFLSFSRTSSAHDHDADLFADELRVLLGSNKKVIANPHPMADVTHLVPTSSAVFILLTEDYFDSAQCIAEAYTAAVNLTCVIVLCTMESKTVDVRKMIKHLDEVAASPQQQQQDRHEWSSLKSRFQISDSVCDIVAALKHGVLSKKVKPLSFLGNREKSATVHLLSMLNLYDEPRPAATSVLGAIPIPSRPRQRSPPPQLFHSIIPSSDDSLVRDLYSKALDPVSLLYYLRAILTHFEKYPLDCVPIFHAGIVPKLLEFMAMPETTERINEACVLIMHGISIIHAQCQAMFRLRVHDACLTSIIRFPDDFPHFRCAMQLITVLVKEATVINISPLALKFGQKRNVGSEDHHEDDDNTSDSSVGDSAPFFYFVGALLKPGQISNMQMVQGGCFLLGALASPESINDLIEFGLLNYLMDSMRLHIADKNIVDGGLITLRCLACTAETRLLLVKLGMGKLLLECFARHSKEFNLTLHACKLLEALTSHPDNCIPLFDAGVGAMLISALRGHMANKYICWSGAASLKYLAANPYIAGSLFDLSAASILVEIITLHCSMNERAVPPSMAMWEVGIESQDYWCQYVRMASWSLLDDYKAATDLDIAKEVLACLDSFCNKAALLAPLVAFGAGKAVIYAVRIFMSDSHATITACRVLSKLGLEKKNRDPLFALGAAQVAVDVLRVYRLTNMEVVNLAGDVLLHLAGDLTRYVPVTDNEGIPFVKLEEFGLEDEINCGGEQKQGKEEVNIAGDDDDDDGEMPRDLVNKLADEMVRKLL